MYDGNSINIFAMIIHIFHAMATANDIVPKGICWKNLFKYCIEKLGSKY